jgi:Xaa-Pro aminopeptidase
MPRISRLDRAEDRARGDRRTGLYYPGRGAVRIEDMVLVEGSGCRNLTRSPKMELLEL